MLRAIRRTAHAEVEATWTTSAGGLRLDQRIAALPVSGKPLLRLLAIAVQFFVPGLFLRARRRQPPRAQGMAKANMAGSVGQETARSQAQDQRITADLSSALSVLPCVRSK